MKRILFATALLGLAWLQGGSASAECGIGIMLEMPVTMVGLKPTVTIKLDGSDARFIADSGAFYSMISPGSAKELGLKLQSAPEGFYISGIGGDQDAQLTTVKTFGLGKYNIANVQFLVGGSEFGSVGLLGQNVLGIEDVEYDLSGSVIRLVRTRGCSRANLAYWTKPGEVYSMLPIDPRPENPLMRHTTGSIYVNGAKMRAMFDTGAAVSMMTLQAARHAGIRTDGPGVVASASSSGIGRHDVRTWIAPVADLKIGDEEIKNTHVRVTDTPDADYDVLIGADFFLSHHVFVSNANAKMYFTYSGGPVFNLTVDAGHDAEADAPANTIALSGGAAPTDADGFSRRAAAFAARRDFDHALADADHAVALAPTEPRFLVQRARIHQAKQQPFLAMSDLDQALKLKPDDPEVLVTRAGMRLHGHDKDGARADLDAAVKALPPAADLRLEIGDLYESMDAFAAAVPQLDDWIAAHPDDHRRANALNSRCWTRALGNLDPAKGVADCNAALHLHAKDPAIIDSRGLAYLRTGDLDRALADYNSALAIDPELPWSLYGRGIIRARRGDSNGAKTDFAAAEAVQPKIEEEARRYGIGP